MRAILDIVIIVLDLYVWLLIASAILSWLIAFNVVNTRNQFVAGVAEFLHRITEPALKPIRQFLPSFGGLDISPRGGQDRIDGVATLASGRSVVKVRVRAIAEGGEANRAVTELLAKELGVPKRDVRVQSGTTSRLKQIAVAGDPQQLGAALRRLTAAK